MTKIIVIGAGVSGIAAASKLLENGFQNILVLEGEDRIGGRINTIQFASNVLDLGAQWCHGEKDNVVYQLGKPLDLFSSATTKYVHLSSGNQTEVEVKYDGILCMKSNGVAVDKNVSEKLTRLLMNIVEDFKDDLVTYRGSLGSFIVDKFEKTLATKEYQDIDKNTAYQYLDFFHRYENSIEASDTWYDTSASGYLHYWECEGDPLLNWKDRGYKTILDILMKKYPNPSNSLHLEDKILFNKTVNNIEWERSDGFVNVTCNDGSSYLADHVISTVSLGVLKERYMSMFSPQLPQLKVNAIQGLSIGTVDKIFLEFDKPFWKPEWKGFSLLWEQNDITEVQKYCSWLNDVYGFFTVDYQPNILCGWVSGQSARAMEMANDDQVKEGVMYLLKKFLTKSFKTIPEPINIKRSSWYTNPHFRGSYSFRSIATDLIKTSAADLAKPITNCLGVPVLQFGGEATHDHYYSTVHGAIESGWREARILIDLYKNPENNRSAPEVQSSLPQIMEEVDVLILGGGLAGLGAAYTLKTTSDLTFLVLEANSVPGGRIKSELMRNIKFIDESGSEAIINAGAQWLHGRENQLYEVAQKHNLLSKELSEEGLGAYLRNDGMRFNDFLVKKVDFIIGQILEDCEEFAQQHPDKPFPCSMGSFLLQEFEKRLPEFHSQSDKLLAKQLLDWHIRFQIIDNSCRTIDDVSAKSWGTYSFNGESCQAHINFKRSFYDVIDVLIKEIGSDLIKCDTKVKKISWGVSTSGTNVPKVMMLSEKGKIYLAKHVICTFSLGVLKLQANSMFEPNLPNSHIQAIEAMGFGTIDKIYLQFNEPWWGNDKGFQLIYEDPNYEVSDWTRMISGFDILQPGPPNTLLGWIGGTGAIEMEKLNDKEIIDRVIQLLEKFSKTQIPKPIKYFVTRWHTNSTVRGSYSYCSKQCDVSNISPKQLSKPILYKDINKRPHNVNDVDDHLNNSPLILFAGEACHEQYYSTAHGAFLSGAEQAREIMKFSIF